MAKYLLDTNICVFLLRGKYNVDKKINSKGWNNCCISEITVAELKYEAELGSRTSYRNSKKALDDFLAQIEIIPIIDTFDLFAEEKTRLRLAETPADDNLDLLIGCTAVHYNMILVTENIKDFRNINGIKLENWIKR